jgi:hypothetical protein
MKNISKPVTIYYTTILVVLFIQVLSTIYQGSVSIYHRHTVGQLTKQKLELLSEKQKLNQQLSETTSLTKLYLTADLSAYETITNPLVITQTRTTVAANSL